MMKIHLLRWLGVLLLLPWLLVACENSDNSQKPIKQAVMTVYKSPTCGCCGKWVDHMEKAGFKVKVEHPEDIGALKAQHGIDAGIKSCHTGIMDGYFFEGHIPADDVKRFLQEKPANARGLSVPKMPVGSPGMEMGEKREPYQVLLIQKDGSHQVYSRH